MTTYDDNLESEIVLALKNIAPNSRWTRRGRWLYTIEIGGITIAAHVATNNKPQFDNFAVNCDEVKRMLDALAANGVQRIYVVAYKLSQYRRHAEASAFYEKKLRHMPKQHGWAGDFWSVAEYDSTTMTRPYDARCRRWVGLAQPIPRERDHPLGPAIWSWCFRNSVATNVAAVSDLQAAPSR